LAFPYRSFTAASAPDPIAGNLLLPLRNLLAPGPSIPVGPAAPTLQARPFFMSFCHSGKSYRRLRRNHIQGKRTSEADQGRLGATLEIPRYDATSFTKLKHLHKEPL
jgi:hypothetical protein